MPTFHRGARFRAVTRCRVAIGRFRRTGEELGKMVKGNLESQPAAPAPSDAARALRTRHRMPGGQPRFTNALIEASSPYLRQHAHNPVDWRPWGPAALGAAMAQQKLILLSIGYSTCHWCHVMETESFEDLEIAGVLNDHFICIKVDREERPDLDRIYMNAVQMMTGRGGWPMTVVMTPDQQPIFAGTYFPPRDGDRGAPWGFLSLLQELARAWRDAPDALSQQGRAMVERARAVVATPPFDLPLDDRLLHHAVVQLARSYDPQWGGFGRGPKFPQGVILELLGRFHRRTGDPRSLEMMVQTLEQICAGGIYDHLGGGFHRYATDRAWRVPHFEKMLYDNAQLVPVLLDAHQITGRADLARVADETLQYLAREMRHPAGGFFSATDADSEDPSGDWQEGYYFTWTSDEIRAVLGVEEATWFGEQFGLTDDGSSSGRGVLHWTGSRKDLSQTDRVRAAREQLRRARQNRAAPFLDRKILAAWNGLAISAFARGSFVLNRPEYAVVAERAARFVMSTLQSLDRLHRTWLDGQLGPAGVLDDYAFVIQGLLDLYEATGTQSWLAVAQTLQRQQDERFADGAQGGYFLTANDGEALLYRDQPFEDGAEPSGNAISAMNLLRLAQLLDDPALRRAAEQTFAAAGRWLADGALSTKLLGALDFYLDAPLRITLVGRSGDSAYQQLLAPLRRSYAPNKVLVLTDPEASASPEEEAGLEAPERVATVQVCRGQTCLAPMDQPAALQRVLSEPSAFAPTTVDPPQAAVDGGAHGLV